MPIVGRPGKQIAPQKESASELTSPGLRRAMGQTAVVKQQMGANLIAQGGQLGDLGIRVHNTQVREEFEDAKLAYDVGMKAHLAEQEKNTDYATWEDNTGVKHDELDTIAKGQFKTSKAQEQFSDWSTGTRAELLMRTSIRADQLLTDKARSMIKIRMENAAKSGRVDEFNEHLKKMEVDGSLTEEEVDFWQQEVIEFTQDWNNLQAKQALEATVKSYYEETGDKKLVIEYIKGLEDSGVSLADKRAMIEVVKYFDAIERNEDLLVFSKKAMSVMRKDGIESAIDYLRGIDDPDVSSKDVQTMINGIKFFDRLDKEESLNKIEQGALQVLATESVEDAIQYVREAIVAPELTGADKQKLINLVEFFDKINAYENDRQKELDKRKEISDWTTMFGKGEFPDPSLIEASKHGVTHQKQWRDWTSNAFNPEPSVNWKKFLELEDTLSEYWNVDQTQYELTVMEARYGDKAFIDDTQFGVLLKRPTMDTPAQYMLPLRSAFKYITDEVADWRGVGGVISENEAEVAAKIRSDLYAFLMEDHVAKKKQLDPKVLYDRAEQLTVVAHADLAGRHKYEFKTPTARRALGGLEDYLKQNKDAKPADLMYDLRNAMKAAREGRNASMVFRRVIEAYQDRPAVQEFLTKLVLPIIEE